MKQFAYSSPGRSIDSILCAAAALQRRDQNPLDWSDPRYWDIVSGHPVHPRRNPSGTPSFAYNPGSAPKHSLGGKGIAHELAQAVLMTLPELTVRLRLGNAGEVVCSVRVEKSQAEHALRLPGQTIKYADVLFNVEPIGTYAALFGGILAVEVCDTHHCTPPKVATYRALGIPAIEIKLPRNMHVANNYTIKQSELEFLLFRLNRLMNSSPYASVLHLPRRFSNENEAAKPNLGQRFHAPYMTRI